MCKIDRSFREVKERKQIWTDATPVTYSRSTKNWKQRKQELEQEENEREFLRREKINELVLPVF